MREQASLTNPASSAKSASSDYPTIERPVAGCAEGEKPFDCDRRAILAMLGGYEVQFKFDETVVLMPGYERQKPKRSMGFESRAVRAKTLAGGFRCNTSWSWAIPSHQALAPGLGL